MRPVTTLELLAVWERGLNLTLLERTLILLGAACPECDPQTIADWPIGERDAHLLLLREWIFGPQLISTAQCPECADKVEWQSLVTDFARSAPLPEPPAAGFMLQVTDWLIHFRLPTSRDLAAVMHQTDATASQSLLNGCILSATHGGKTCTPNGLPEAVLADLTAQMEALDPLTDIRIDLTCPQCNHRWTAWFDITGYLWEEIQHWAEETLATVHQLARAYGWSEGEILELSPVRRQLYLGMINS